MSSIKKLLYTCTYSKQKFSNIEQQSYPKIT